MDPANSQELQVRGHAGRSTFMPPNVVLTERSMVHVDPGGHLPEQIETCVIFPDEVPYGSMIHRENEVKRTHQKSNVGKCCTQAWLHR